MCPECGEQAEHECDVCGLPWSWCDEHCCRCRYEIHSAGTPRRPR